MVSAARSRQYKRVIKWRHIETTLAARKKRGEQSEGPTKAAFLFFCSRNWRGVIPSRPQGVAAPFVVRPAARPLRRLHTYRAHVRPREDSVPEVESEVRRPQKGIPWEDC